MTTKSNCTSVFSDEMNHLIRSIVELSLKEGYNISSVQRAIASEFKAHTNEQFSKFENAELEEKLLALFEDKLSEVNRERIERLLVICETYYEARKISVNVNLTDIARVIAERFSLKESSAKCEITHAGHLIKTKIFDMDIYRRLDTRIMLEMFYINYMK